MKRRCQCPKPSFASIGIKQLLNGNYDNFGYHLNPKDCLHFKVATTECEKCGRGLCEDCCTGGQVIDHNWDYSIFYVVPTLCSLCVEVI